jgi:pseudaminic acid biosynthesis-associated methylase
MTKSMPKATHQMHEWQENFGKLYTDRNDMALEEMEALYLTNYGFTKSDLNKRFLEGISHTIRILEVGSNIGNQLMCLQNIGFVNLYGIELQNYAVELSKSRTCNMNIIQGSAFDIPFKNDFFDLVLTSGLLIHIHPSDVSNVMKEIHRCSKDYILGHEYWSSEFMEVKYREHSNLLWKGDYSQAYIELFEDLVLIKEERINYRNNDNIDSMFLLRKS